MPKFTGMSTQEAIHLRNGGKDAHGNLPEHAISDGQGNPCRHCLQMIAKGEEFLIFSHRPFDSCQPYAEQGPVFLHANSCQAYEALDAEADSLPPVLEDSPRYLLRGYDANERIVYGSGTLTETNQIVETANHLLTRKEISFVHVRSATNNCWQARIDLAKTD
ncbi:MAG: DUF1203 domain-containing protein [Rhizobiaceae bacterium]